MKLKEIGVRLRGVKKYWWLSLIFLIFFFWLLGLLIPGVMVFNQAKQLMAQSQDLKASLKTRDLRLIKTKIDQLEQELEKLAKRYRWLVLARVTPILRNYYFDGEKLLAVAQSGLDLGQIAIEAVAPYQDFLGLKGASSSAQLQGGEKTTEERIAFLVETIEGVKPRLSEIEAKLGLIEEKLNQIEVSRYPQQWRNYPIRNYLAQAQRISRELNQLVKEGRPLIERADWLLGKKEPRYYLFLFQNDGELRPTGGFWTAYGILKVDKGKVSPVISEDIYALDARFKSTIPAPRPIKNYHKNVYYWYLRDMNLSPDFEESVTTFIKYYREVKEAHSFDGVVAVDTQLLVDLLKVLGRIGVPGWGNFGPEPDDRCWGCPQVVYQLELLADKPVATFRSNRKGFLAPLMHSIIANALGSPKDKVSQLVNVALDNLRKKHILVYFEDPELQRAVRSLKIGGKIEDFNGDYFHLNDTNFAGAKSNLFIQQTVKQEYRIDSTGKIVKKVTVVYQNTAPASDCNLERGGLCLNGLYRNWFRFYVPKGSRLIKMTGSEVKPQVYDELGKTVFEGFYGDKYPLYPQGSTRVTVEYELPFKINDSLSLLIQKQPGTRDPKYQIVVNGKQKQTFKLTSDRLIVINN